MNVQDYRAAGYALSTLIDQAAVTRAEKDVVAAYIVPLVGQVTQAECEAEPIRSAIMSLAFLLVAQRTAVATRAGAKTKQTAQSATPTADEVLRQNAPACVNYLRTIAGDKNPVKECSDICGLFYTGHYFYPGSETSFLTSTFFIII